MWQAQLFIITMKLAKLPKICKISQLLCSASSSFTPHLWRFWGCFSDPCSTPVTIQHLQHHFPIQTFPSSRKQRSRTKAEVPSSLRGTEVLVYWSRYIGDLVATKVAKPFQPFWTLAHKPLWCWAVLVEMASMICRMMLSPKMFTC